MNRSALHVIDPYQRFNPLKLRDQASRLIDSQELIQVIFFKQLLLSSIQHHGQHLEYYLSIRLPSLRSTGPKYFHTISCAQPLPHRISCASGPSPTYRLGPL